MNTIAELAESVGIVLDKEPVPDGKIHYAKTIDDKPGKLSGRYVLRPENNLTFLWLMNHKTGKQIKQWISDKALKQKYKAIDKEAQKLQDSLDDTIKQITIKEKWESAASPVWVHEYLLNKGIKPHCARVDKLNRLVIPVRDVLTAELKGLQYIGPNGAKKFEPGTKQKGNGVIVSGDPAYSNNIYIAEGFATASTIAESLAGYNTAVIAALCCNNILQVVKRFNTFYPSKVIVFADNDQFTEGNPGIKHAIQAANEVGCKFIYPEFKEEHLIQKPTDFNDFARLYGKEELRRFINERIK